MKWRWVPPDDAGPRYGVPHIRWRIKHGLHVELLDWRSDPATTRTWLKGGEGIAVVTGTLKVIKSEKWDTIQFIHPDPLVIQCWLTERNLLPPE